jgi:hypothetical protein
MAGAILHVIAKGYLRPGRDYLQRTKAITTCGPYRFTRNPFYLANLLAELGLLCVIGRLWVALFYLPIWAWVYCETILKEERKLLGLCGEIYQRYCNQVPRFFPRPWHYLSRTEASGPRFSWANPHFVHGCEIRRALRLVSYPFLLRASAAAMALPHWTDCLRDPTFITFATAFVAMSIVGWSTTPPRKDLLPANHPDYGILG